MEDNIISLEEIEKYIEVINIQRPYGMKYIFDKENNACYWIPIEEELNNLKLRNGLKEI
jgi:hypothetical protein